MVHKHLFKKRIMTNLLLGSKLIASWVGICHSSSKRHEKLSKIVQDLFSWMKTHFVAWPPLRNNRDSPPKPSWMASLLKENFCFNVNILRSKHQYISLSALHCMICWKYKEMTYHTPRLSSVRLGGKREVLIKSYITGPKYSI